MKVYVKHMMFGDKPLWDEYFLKTADTVIEVRIDLAGDKVEIPQYIKPDWEHNIGNQITFDQCPQAYQHAINAYCQKHYQTNYTGA